MKRILSIILLFAFCYCPLCSAEYYTSEAQLGLASLENLITSLQNDLLTQQILAQNLKDSLTTAEKQLNTAETTVTKLTESLTEASQLQETQSKLLKKQDTMLHVLKWSLILSIPIAFTTGLTIGLNLNK